MEYNFEADSFGASFSFPWAAVGGHIKDCTEAQIKILLCILAGASYTNSAVISAISGYDETEVDAAVEYWCSAGALHIKGKNIGNVEPIAAPVAEKSHTFSGKNEPVSLVEAVRPAKTTAIDKKVTVRYTQREMREKMEKDSNLKYLVNEIQTLQFSINGNECAKLIELYEYYKFDVPSILLVADYCQRSGKSSIAYLCTVMTDWFNKGINTFSEVEQAIIHAGESKAFENKVAKLFGMENKPSKKQLAFINEWQNMGYNTELIEIAYDKCLDAKGKLSFNYINGILKNWAEKGITTAEQSGEEDKRFKNQQAVSRENEKPSFNLAEFEEYANNIDLSSINLGSRKDD